MRYEAMVAIAAVCAGGCAVDLNQNECVSDRTCGLGMACVRGRCVTDDSAFLDSVEADAGDEDLDANGLDVVGALDARDLDATFELRDDAFVELDSVADQSRGEINDATPGVDVLPDPDAPEADVTTCAPHEEVCNGLDDDCDRLVDETRTWELAGRVRWYEPCFDPYAEPREFPTRVDVETGLEWTEGSSSRAWNEAADFCADLGHPGDEWRVPSLEELGTLYISGAPEGVCHALYLEIWPEATCGELWAKQEADAARGWAFDFVSGEQVARPKETDLLVRCVRGR